jgi:hypothetical protein
MKRITIQRMRMLTPTGRVAACHFRFARMAKGRRGGEWHALALFWRRKAKRQQRYRTSKTTLLHTIGAPQLHLHFSEQALTQAYQNLFGKRAELGATPSVHRHLILNRYQANVHATADTPLGRVNRSLQVLFKKGRNAAMTAVAGAPQLPRAATVLPGLSAGGSHSAEGVRRERLVSRTERRFTTRTSAVRSTAHLHHRQEHLHRTVTVSTALTPQSSRTERKDPRAPRPPDFVWRRAPLIAEPMSENRRDLEDLDSTPETRSQSGAPQVNEQSVPAPVKLQAADLDPGFVDRLTDDVIRRVERRVRIERERRGL